MTNRSGIRRQQTVTRELATDRVAAERQRVEEWLTRGPPGQSRKDTAGEGPKVAALNRK